MLIDYILFFAGIVLLVKGADSLVDGSVSLARKLGVSSLVVGLTVVSFGTSMPELLVNLISAFKGETDIGLGNIVGSNLANILLVLGLTAVLYPVRVHKSVIWKEIPFSLLAALVLFIVANDTFIDLSSVALISRIDWLLLLSFFVIFLYYIIQTGKRTRMRNIERTLELAHLGYLKISLLILGGTIGLFLVGKFVVDGAIILAQTFGLSEFLISSTIIAIGTSLPELITSVTAAKKGKVGISVGNIVGSNIFNVLFILAITSVIFPIPVKGIINVDMIFLIFVSVLLFIFMFVGKKHMMEKWKGALFVGLYLLYLIFNIIRG